MRIYWPRRDSSCCKGGADLRGEFFKTNYPASMLTVAKDFAYPNLLLEIQAVAVIGD